MLHTSEILFSISNKEKTATTAIRIKPKRQFHFLFFLCCYMIFHFIAINYNSSNFRNLLYEQGLNRSYTFDLPLYIIFLRILSFDSNVVSSEYEFSMKPGETISSTGNFLFLRPSIIGAMFNLKVM